MSVFFHLHNKGTLYIAIYSTPARFGMLKILAYHNAVGKSTETVAL